MIIIILVTLYVILTKGLTLRRNYLSLTQEERDAFHNAVWILKDMGEWDEFVRIHDVAFTSAIDGYNTSTCGTAHNCPSFLPWHRAYLKELELRFQNVFEDDTWGLPYWDWLYDSRVYTDPTQAVVWTPNYMGGDGVIDSNDEVHDGPFAYMPLTYDMAPNNPNKLLQRRLGRQSSVCLSLPNDVGNEAAMIMTDYDISPYTHNPEGGFRTGVEGDGNVAGGMQMHNQAHCWIGGTMGVGSASNDPIFHLHHNFIDLLWDEWQQLQLERFPESSNEDHYQPQSGGPNGHNIDDVMLTLGEWIYTPRDTLDVNTLGYMFEPRIQPPHSALDALCAKKALADALIRKKQNVTNITI